MANFGDKVIAQISTNQHQDALTMSNLNLNRAHDSRNHPVPHHYFQHTENAHRIRSDQEAIEIAQRLAERFAKRHHSVIKHVSYH